MVVKLMGLLRIALQVYVAKLDTYVQSIQVIAVQRSRMAADYSNESSLVMAYILQLITLISPMLYCK